MRIKIIFNIALCTSLLQFIISVQVCAQTNSCGWNTKTPMSTARANYATAVADNKLYVIGGQTAADCNPSGAVEMYDPVTNIWSTKTNIPTPRWGMGAVSVSGIIYVVGGATGCGNATNTVEAYNPATNSWSSKTPTPTARYDMAIGVINGLIYVVAGSNSSQLFNTVEVYNPATDTWSTAAPIPTGRTSCEGVVLNNMLYVLGGQEPDMTNIVEVYDPVTNIWSTKASMHWKRTWGFATGVVNGNIYVVGGLEWVSSSLTIYGSDMEIYDPVTNAWNDDVSMPTGRCGITGEVIDNILYVIGGFSNDNGYMNVNEAFKTAPIINADIDAIVFFGGSSVTQDLNCTTLTATVTSGAVVGSNFNWSSTPTSSILNNASNQISVCPTVNTIYTVTYTTPSGCIATDEVLVKAIDVSCGNNNNKVKICITTSSGQQQTICVANESIQSVLTNNPNAVLGDCSSYNIRINNTVSEEVKPTEFGIYPNPSNNYFTLQIGNDKANQKISLRILDLQGRVVEIRNNLNSNQTLQIGNNYRPGVYIAEILQGNRRGLVKLVKL